MPNHSKLTLPSNTEIRLTRVFNGPPARVYRAWTEPKLLTKWMNPPSCQMTDASVDVRPGGRLVYTYKTPHGEMQQEGEYLEVVPEQKLVFTEARGPMAWRTTVEFDGDDEKTTVTVTHHMADTAARDEALASGMDDLWEHAWKQLDQTVTSAP